MKFTTLPNTNLKVSKADFEMPKNGVSIVYDCNAYEQTEQTTTELDKKLGF